MSGKYGMPNRETVLRGVLHALTAGMVLVLAGRASAQGKKPPGPGDSHHLRSKDAYTTDTLAHVTAHLAGDGVIDFPLLKKTTLPQKPPPVYPDPLQQLDGKRVRMVGFMTPYDSLVDMHNFMLMSTPTGCFFCDPPDALQVVFVRQKERDNPRPYIDAPTEVTGTLRLWSQDLKDPAHKQFIYVIDDAEAVEVR
ncbi:DUF3299 domain-containing protein [Candidatus Poribacteria bacterium]|nr:DUF3299 domain-containing protein [Candidatus Poribacteria bacterium]